MRKPLAFTIVIPTHNRRSLLERLLIALLALDYDKDAYEIIVVHNYTQDGTEEMVASMAAGSAVSLRYYKKNYKGPAASRSFGASVANHEVIAFIDDDCVPTQGWLAEAEKYFQKNKALGLLQGRTIPMPNQPRHLLEKTILIDKQSIYFETCNIFYRRETYEAVGGFSPDFIEKFYGEDTDLGWKVKLAGYPCEFSQEAEVHHEVFKVSYWRWLKEPLFFVNLPYLVGKVSPLRAFMFKRYFLTTDTCLFYGVLFALIALPFYPLASLLLALPYFVFRYMSANHMPNPLMRVARIIFGLPRSFFMWWALFKGSIKARSILL